MSRPLSRRRRLALYAFAAYAFLLLLSHLIRAFAPTPPPPTGREFRDLREVGRSGRSGRPVRLVWRQWGGEAAGTPVILIHGSPGSSSNFRRIGPVLGQWRRTMAPDLPGFGDSTAEIADYSIRAHAAYLLQLLEAEGIARVHLLGFSMGGGVALELYRLAPERVASVTLLSAIGVQELELLGNYHLNHLVHGLQLAAIWLLQEGFPHMGRMDRFGLDLAYARNFFDTDQRPLRRILATFEPPLLIVHGEDDPLVPAAAAREHERIVPQSELVMLPASHFFVFRGRFELAERLERFFALVDAGGGARRSDASPQRLAAAAVPFDETNLPSWAGPSLLAVMVLLALATLVSEDLTCLGAGVLVAQGRMAFIPAVLGCFAGILAGDILLFWVGRILGRPALRLPPLRWWVSERAVEESSAWLRRRGALVIGLSRFMPGARLPTYLAAGLLRTSFLGFAFYFGLAAAVWTPLVVLASATLGEAALRRLETVQYAALISLGLLVALMTLVRGVILPLLSHRGRRRLVGRLRRWSRWEFWPPWLFYPPVIAYVLLLGLRHRCMTLFTAVNPAIPAGGFVGESKAAILDDLKELGAALPQWRAIPACSDRGERRDLVEAFLAETGLDYPVVLKPDAGQRGTGVAVVRSGLEVDAYLERHGGETLVQEYVPGEEFGVFYYRFPDTERGELLSINEKRFPTVTGDGKRTVEQLILDDERAVAIADTYLNEQGADASKIPAVGEEVQLVEIAAHSRGTIFLDAGDLKTPALETAIDALARRYEGFDFGRFDIRVPDRQALRRGEDLRVIEVNGVTSEATHLYDPKHSLFEAWRILFDQWHLAFEIGAVRRRLGARPTPLRRLLGMVLEYRRRAG